MKAHILIQSALVGMLGVFAWNLVERLPASSSEREAVAAGINQSLRLTAIRGVGVHGDPIDLGKVNSSNRVAAFLVRAGSLSDDLAFWEEVARHLPSATPIRLVGYCDSPACVSAFQSRPHRPAFPILAYGEVVDSQAVVNADVQGAFVVAGEAAHVPWRGQAGPRHVAQLLTQ